jgi:hypothetical protein
MQLKKLILVVIARSRWEWRCTKTWLSRANALLLPLVAGRGGLATLRGPLQVASVRSLPTGENT